MPPFPGEETLATVFVDVHIYFAAPSPRPFLHRFDKSSYFYIYFNSTRNTTRIELALHPGTPDQAAFNGFLDTVKIANSSHFPTKVTLEVDGISQPGSSPSSARGRDPDEWRLASADPRDAGTTKYRIHTIDLYFWMQEDAKLILDIFERLLDRHQLDLDEIDPEPDSGHHDVVSPVVQNLENVAISDPAYHKGKHQEVNVPQPHGAQLPPPPPPPPTLQATPQAQQPASDADPSVKGLQPDQNYTPLAYNPAAPAAPEPIAHREDTPPPVDGDDGTGLSAAMHDNPYAHQPPPPPQQHYGVPPGPQPGAYGHYGSPPGQPYGPHTTSPAPPSFGPNAGSQPSFGPHAVPSPRTSIGTGFSPPPPNATSPDGSRHPSLAAQTYSPNSGDPNAHIFGQQPPVQSPGAQFYQTITQPHKPLQHVHPQYPDYLASGQAAPPQPQGGYSSYQYGQAAQQQQPSATAGNPYDVHSQFYRPTEDEHQTRHHSKPSRTSTSSQQHRPGNVEKVEKSMGRFFKKIEKKIG
ncbi:uncharacterized protein A1O9_12936 [Exophiala aquamarina CBS 119918]|uniref:Uncharacterized protein n=1 Tax=Exophiala aquamarina CBS 119918 TaxID=1182545 RepID=A0A072P5W7_9EURO|nr:uncharacterized protein A1O9_12936 [Exophiala aquamarina CBS 119918]KEF51010.1 hypothetical protein A1O9_12936 [Exophiala aquamarina CBS 119918]